MIDINLGGLRGGQSVQFFYRKAKTLLNICGTILKVTSRHAAAQPMQCPVESEHRKHGGFKQHAGNRRSLGPIHMENIGQLIKIGRRHIQQNALQIE